jgi:14-3-3 protein epsilon
VHVLAEERHLFATAYKKVMTPIRFALRALSAQREEHMEAPAGSEQKNMAEASVPYFNKVRKELESYCEDAINMLDQRLIPRAFKKTNVEVQVFYTKMRADQYRYLAEFADEKVKGTHTATALHSYEQSASMAGELHPTNVVRLGLALNFSVFLFEVLNQAEAACGIAKSAFDDALAAIDEMRDEEHQESTFLMQRIRDNVSAWGGDKPYET